MYRIGVVGFCYPTKFDSVKVWELVSSALTIASNSKEDVMVVGGLTDIPSIHQAAYYIARQKGWNCGGIACKQANKFKWFPMSNDGDMLKIVGDNWGDESEEFINNIDVLIAVGGGKQSKKEIAMAKEKGIEVYTYELEVGK